MINNLKGFMESTMLISLGSFFCVDYIIFKVKQIC